jgi:hypothetical protein
MAQCFPRLRRSGGTRRRVGTPRWRPRSFRNLGRGIF